MNAHIRRWRRERLSKGKRDELLRFNQAMFENREKMATKNKPVEAVEVPATTAAPFKYVDANGLEQTIDLLKVKNLGDTAYAESQKLFPNATQCYIGQEGVQFDDEGRENVIGQNLVILEARRLTKGKYGPWFLLRCAHPTLGEISIPAPGKISNEAIEQLSGIALRDHVAKNGDVITKAGDQFQASEFPIWARFEFVPDAGDYDGYFVIMPAIQELAESDD